MVPIHWRSFILLVVGMLLANGCDTPGSSPQEVVSFDETAALEQVGTLEVQETDERFIGELVDAEVTVDPLRLYVADQKMQRVAVIKPDGSIERFIGKPGKGPGELGTPNHLSVHDGNVVVAQQRWRGFSVFDTSGTYIDNYRLSDGYWAGGGDLFITENGYLFPVTTSNPRKRGTLKTTADEPTIAKLNSEFEVTETFGTFPSLYQEEEHVLRRRTMDVRGDTLAARAIAC